MRHVTIVTFRAAGTRAVMRVTENLRLLTKAFVTLQASPIVRAVAGKLIVRVAVVERMAGKTGELTTTVAR
jgi:hypothetical protein